MRRIAAAAMATVALISCSQQPPEAKSKHFVPDADLPFAKESDVQTLRERVSKLEGRVFAIEYANSLHAAAWFDPTGDKSYQRVDTDVASFLVVLQHVQPYLDGQRVTLLIGNPNNVVFSGLEIHAMWTKRVPDAKLAPQQLEKAWNEYNSSQREKNITLTDTLRPGYWNKVSFTVAPAKADDFGALGIGLKVNSLRLAGGK